MTEPHDQSINPDMVDDEYRDEPPTGRYPPGFANWPHDAQIEHVRMKMTRKGLIAELLSRAGLDIADIEIRDDSKLTKNELAAIYLVVEGQSHGR